MTKQIIFLGNGPLADAAKATLEQHFDIVFHAHTKDDLTEVMRLKREQPELSAILASFGVLIRENVLDLFEPEGILNIHPSLLPKYRGPSPIESAILAGDTDFGVSVMKLTKGMDAGPIYWQTSFPEAEILSAASQISKNSPKSALNPTPVNVSETAKSAQNPTPVSTSEIKSALYRCLATAGAEWLCQNLAHLPTPQPQDDQDAIYTTKLEKTMGEIDPNRETASEILRKIIAFQGFPKVKYAFYGQKYIILDAHTIKKGTTAPLVLECLGDQNLAIDRLQPEGRKPMDAKSFLNGYSR